LSLQKKFYKEFNDEKRKIESDRRTTQARLKLQQMTVFELQFPEWEKTMIADIEKLDVDKTLFLFTKRKLVFPIYPGENTAGYLPADKQ
jgi:hypothetical protein